MGFSFQDRSLQPLGHPSDVHDIKNFLPFYDLQKPLSITSRWKGRESGTVGGTKTSCKQIPSHLVALAVPVAAGKVTTAVKAAVMGLCVSA